MINLLLLLLAPASHAANVSADNFLAYTSMQCFDPGDRTKKVTIKSPTLGSSWVLTLPNSGGTNGYVLQTNGSGTTTWAQDGGVTTMGTFGSSPNANGGTISGSTLTLQPADASNPGGVTTGSQTLAGAKTFSSAPTFSTMTLGSALFAGTGGLLSQDNSNYFWDNTNKNLNIGGAVGNGATIGSLNVKAKSDSLGALLQLEGPGTGGNRFMYITQRENGDFFFYNPAGRVLIDYNYSGNSFTLGQAGGDYQFQVTAAQTSTTPASPPGLGSAMVSNFDTTNGNYSGLLFKGSASGLNPDSGVYGIHDLHSGASSSGSLEFWTRNAGTYARKMRIGVSGTVTMDSYSSGFAWFDSSANLTSKAVTASRAVITGTDGAPTAGATTATELGYVSGVTSSIQTQLNARSVNAITALSGDGTASGPGNSALTLATVNSNVGSFTNANITVNAKGLITAASSGTSGVSITTFSMSVIGTTTTPTRGTITSQVATYYCEGNMLNVAYDYRSPGTGATDGSGTYLWTLPNNNRIDTSKVGSLPYGASGWIWVGTGMWSSASAGFNSSSSPIQLYAYDETHVFAAYFSSFNVMSVVGSGAFQMSGTQVTSFRFKVPVVSCQ